MPVSDGDRRSRVPSPPSAVPVRLVAVALADETTWWLGEPRSAKVLTEEPAWTQCWCHWLYPADVSPESFAHVPGFHPSSTIYEVGQDGESKVFHTAALADDVEATKVTIDRVSYVFVPQQEAKRMDLIYKAMLRREAEAVLPAEDAKETAAEGAVKEIAVKEVSVKEVAVEKAAARVPKAPPAIDRTSSEATDLALADAWHGDDFFQKHSGSRTLTAHGHSLSSSVSMETTSSTPAKRVGHHGRRRPLEGTTVIVAPTLHEPQGEHASQEAFAWPRHYIAHIGTADYLCPAAANNTYGFRLDKVTNMGFPVFLLFGSSTKSSYTFSPPVRGVPVHESTILTGQGIADAEADRQVLIFTRLSSKRMRGQQGSGSTTHRAATRRAPSDDGEDDMPEDDGDDDDGDETDDDDEEDDEEEIERRERAARKRRRTASTTGHSHQPRRTSRHTSSGHGRHSHRSTVPSAPALPPLTAMSVNLWTEPQVAIPPVAELANRHPFSAEPTASGMQTTVFPDGICVTYSAATASKCAPNTKKSTSSSASGGGGGNVLDDDMRGLLENIELATMQNHASTS